MSAIGSLEQNGTPSRTWEAPTEASLSASLLSRRASASEPAAQGEQLHRPRANPLPWRPVTGMYGQGLEARLLHFTCCFLQRAEILRSFAAV